MCLGFVFAPSLATEVNMMISSLMISARYVYQTIQRSEKQLREPSTASSQYASLSASVGELALICRYSFTTDAAHCFSPDCWSNLSPVQKRTR